VVTTKNRTTGETAVGDAQLPFNSAAGYAFKAGEINIEIAERMIEVWMEGFRKQGELSQQFLEKVEERRDVDEVFFGRSSPFMWAPYVHDPFAFWREWARRVQENTWDAHETPLRTAREVRESAAEQTARAVEVTVPSNGTFPIAGYDEKHVGEISRRLNTLTVEQLQRVKHYERRNRNRETFVREIDRKIAAAS
jgi:hypothetical protein